MLKKIIIGLAVFVGLYGLVQLLPVTQSTSEAKSWEPYASDMSRMGSRKQGGLLFEIMPQDTRWAFQSMSISSGPKGGRKTQIWRTEPFHVVTNCEGSFCTELRIPADRYDVIKKTVSENWNWIKAATDCFDKKSWCGATNWSELEARYDINAAQWLRDYMKNGDGTPCAEVQHCRELTSILGPIPAES